MKRPLSPTCLLENGRICLPISPCLELKDPGSYTDLRAQREKKRLLFSLCEVCNIQLNSAAQAQVHYNGRSHLKRVKQLNNGELPTGDQPGATLGSGSSADLAWQRPPSLSLPRPGVFLAGAAARPSLGRVQDARGCRPGSLQRPALFVPAQDITQPC